MRILLVMVTMIGLVACVPPPAEPANAGTAQQGGDPSGCGAGCDHYLGCKGITDQATWAQCNDECVAANMDPAVIADYTQTDCATAIQLVEGEGGMQQGGEAPANGACTADCHGCVWDGTECYYNASAAMGATQACEACCCAEGGPAPRWD
jgi:hypothetical protein